MNDSNEYFNKSLVSKTVDNKCMEYKILGNNFLESGNLPNYRKNVAAVILSDKYPLECQFFIAERIDLRGVWQFPQGGIDAGENSKEALFRELQEEIGTDEVEIIAEAPGWIKYDFPSNIVEKMKPNLGQIQKYFLIRLKNDLRINIKTEHAEFNKFMFVEFDDLLVKINKFKKPVYKQILFYFKTKGYI